MPTNRTRRRRERTILDDHKITDLMHGPGASLLAGCGYLCGSDHGRPLAKFEDADLARQAQILDIMREDWRTHSDIVIAAFTGDGEPWALTEFGAP